MSSVIPVETNAVNPNERNYYGNTRSRSGICTIDTPMGETALGLYVGTAGNVVLQGVDGVTYYLPALTVGTEHHFKFNAILSSGTVSGVSVTTTATNIVWVGGEN